jgi:hypothetical protein
MQVQQPNKIRKAVLIGAVGVALTGAGVAVVSATSGPPTPSPSTASPSATPGSPAPEKGNGTAHGRQLHGESVVKKGDGSFETRVTQQGTVEAVSGSSITVKSEDGFSQDYVINADTKIVKLPEPVADGTAAKDDAGKRLRPSAATAADIKQGDTVRISGVRDGSSVTARNIVDGAAGAKGNGLGLGHGLGRGHGLGHGRGMGNGNAQGSRV